MPCPADRAHGAGMADPADRPARAYAPPNPPQCRSTAPCEGEAVGTYRQTVVDLDASAEEAVAWGERGRNWLEAEGFIRPVPWQDAVDLAPWDRRSRIKELEAEPVDELQVVTGRTVFFAGRGDSPSAICPRCRSTTSDSDWSGAATDTWYATGAACRLGMHQRLLRLRPPGLPVRRPAAPPPALHSSLRTGARPPDPTGRGEDLRTASRAHEPSLPRAAARLSLSARRWWPRVPRTPVTQAGRVGVPDTARARVFRRSRSRSRNRPPIGRPRDGTRR